MRGVLEARAPAILPGDTERIEAAADAGDGARAAVELDGVVAVDGNGNSAPPPDFPPPLPFLPVDGRAPTRIVGDVHGRPQADPGVVDHVALQREERIYMERAMDEEVVVIRVEGGAR